MVRSCRLTRVKTPLLSIDPQPLTLNLLLMFRNYLLIAFRNFVKFRGYSLINLIGLSIGIASTWIIFLYLRFEFSYDSFHPNVENLYNIDTKMQIGDQELIFSDTPLPLQQLIEEQVPEVSLSVPSTGRSAMVYAADNPTFITRENQLLFTESSFLDLLNFPLLSGTQEALNTPFSVFLTESTARKYFGDGESQGKILYINIRDSAYAFTIAGVLKDLPKNSSLTFDLLGSMETIHSIDPERNWGNFSSTTYVSIPESVNLDTLSSKLVKLTKQLAGEVYWVKNNSFEYLFNSLGDKHLGAGPLRTNPQKRLLMSFGLLAVLILLMACINYLNLSTARSITREKEIGVRKVLGAKRKELSLQFFCEALSYSLFASFLGACLTDLTLPYFFDLLGKQFAPALWKQPETWLGVVGLGLFTGLLAGTYPALYLSGLGKIAERFSQKKEKKIFTKGLTTFQFTVATLLISGVIIISQQIRFMQRVDLGFEKDQIVYIQLNSAYVIDKAKVLKSEMEQLPQVEIASLGSGTMAGMSGGRTIELSETQKSMVSAISVDEALIDAMDFQITSGKWFEGISDRGDYLVNEAFVKDFELKNPIGTPLSYTQPSGRIIGVVEDFYFGSLKHAIRPIVIQHVDSSYMHHLALKLGKGEWNSTLKELKKVWEGMFPLEAFEYEFLDQQLEQLYTDELRFARIIGIFTALAILISCLGLLALIAFTTSRRSKEVGIRKILGASLKDIAILLNKSFFQLIGIAILIAIPLSWWLASLWLESYAYHIKLGPVFFLLAVGIILGISILTVSFFTFKAAGEDPVHALRYE